METALVRDVSSAFSDSPSEAIAALLEAQPGQVVFEEPAEVAGLVILSQVKCLLIAHAGPAALLLLGEMVHRAATCQAPFTPAYPQNLLPDLPWLCLRQILEIQILGREMPLSWALLLETGQKDSGPHLDAKLIDSWFDRLAPGSPRLTTNDTLPHDRRLHELIEKCGLLCETWEPGFMLSMAQGRGKPSERLLALLRILSGRHGGDANAHGVTDPQTLQKAWARHHGNAARSAIPALAQLCALARWAGADEVKGFELAQRATRLLSPLFMFSGGLLGDQAHELLNGLFGAEASRGLRREESPDA